MIAFKGLTRNLLLIAGTIIIVFLIWYFSAIVTYCLISVVLSFIGKPIVNWLEMLRIRKFRIPKSMAAFIALIILWVGFIGFFRFIIPLLINEFETLSSVDFNAVLQEIQESLNQIASFTSSEKLTIDDKSFYDLVREQLSTRFEFSQLSNILGFVAGTVGELLIGFFSVSFFTFFFLKEQSMFRNGILLIVPSEMEEKIGKILNSITYLLRRYFIGLMFEVVMVMLLVTIGLIIIGIEFEHAVVIGLFCGLFNVIPYLGPWMGASIGILINIAINLNADFMSHTLPVIGLMVLVFAIVQILDNILFQPLIYSNSVKAHPLEIFIVILAAGSLAGILGMILAIPVYTIIRVIAKEFFDNLKIVRKLTENLDQTTSLPFKDK